MRWIFVVTDISKRKIHLSQKQWSHIITFHPDVTGQLREIEETLLHPLFLRKKWDPHIRFYYRWYKERKKYLMVEVKYLNGEGFIITALFVRNIAS